MANPVSLLPPERFDFDHPDTWPRWIKRFERYRVASGLSAKDEQVQISTLIYAMGEEAEDILASFRLSKREWEFQRRPGAVFQALRQAAKPHL